MSDNSTWFNQLFSLFQEKVSNDEENLKYLSWMMNAIFVFGAFKLCSLASSLLGLFNRQIIRPLFQSKTRLYDTYGNTDAGGKKLSWAVVTGGSDGIGLAMCKDLASQGFNICIVSRNESKINEKLDEIKKEFPEVKTLCIVADMGKLTSIK